MKVLALTWACDGEDVSEPQTTFRWVSELAKDHEVTLFSVSKPDRWGCVQQQFPSLRTIEWRDIRLPRFLHRLQAVAKPGFVPYYVKARRYLTELLRQEEFDVIHHLSPFGWRYPSPASGLGVPLVRGPVAGGLQAPAGLRQATAGSDPYALFRVSDTLRRRFDPVLRGSYRQTQQVLISAPYVSAFLSDLCAHELLVEPPHGTDEQWLREPRARQSEGEFVLLYVGRLVRWKGARDAIRAVATARNRSRLRLIVVGDGPDLEPCKREAAELGVSRNVNFLGWKPRREVMELYAQGDAFVFPSFREPVGAVVLEAMSSGLPCIVCAAGGPGFLVNESCGRIVSPQSEMQYAKGLAAAIDELVENEELRARLARGAYERAATYFPWSRKRERIAALYEAVIARFKDERSAGAPAAGYGT